MAAEDSRPRLLPQNRRIRHLKGIYVRNLTLSRPRGRTIDDGALNKTSQKLESLRVSDPHHTRASSELRPPKLRRASTNWAAASPGFRQKKLEDVIDSRMADTFFSLHVEGMEEPIYLSEVVEKAMNPTYRFCEDIATLQPSITRMDTITVKIWVKRDDWMPLIEEEVHLLSLQFIGTLENHIFPSNCILFHLVDGIYTIDLSSKPPKPKDGPALPTSSYSELMKLSNLDESIQDALATREAIASQINAIIESQAVDESPQAQEDLALATKYVHSERKLLKIAEHRREELKASIAARRKAIESGRKLQAKSMEDVDNAQEKLSDCRILLKQTEVNMHGQRRRICEDLLEIFPIEPTNHPLLFTINGLQLPNSVFGDADEDTVSAALGYVAFVVGQLQYYLKVHLPYPVSPWGSRAIINDNISILQDNQRVFPLYMKGTVRFRFDYGVFLLNKNIERLAESQGLKVMDIRQTLPNLKYLLYVCSAGSSELPSRKAGGVRGLISGRGIDSSIGSRRGSADSGVDGAQSDAVRKALESGGKKDEAGTENENGHLHETAMSFKGNYIHTGSLRTKGMRENVR